MTTFDDREDFYEKQFAHDAELQFKAESRQAKLFGLWVAERLGLSGDDAEKYAKDVVVSGLQEPGNDDILAKVMPDLEKHGTPIDRDALNKRLDELMLEARQQVLAEAGKDQ